MQFQRDNSKIVKLKEKWDFIKNHFATHNCHIARCQNVNTSYHIRDKWEKPKTVEEAFAAVKPRRRVGTVVRYSLTLTQYVWGSVTKCSLTSNLLPRKWQGYRRSKREKEEETTRTVVVRGRHQSDSDEGEKKIILLVLMGIASLIMRTMRLFYNLSCR